MSEVYAAGDPLASAGAFLEDAGAGASGFPSGLTLRTFVVDVVFLDDDDDDGTGGVGTAVGDFDVEGTTVDEGVLSDLSLFLLELFDLFDARLSRGGRLMRSDVLRFFPRLPFEDFEEREPLEETEESLCFFFFLPLEPLDEEEDME